MARLPRLVVPGQLHLLLQRAPAGSVVLQADEDCASYRQALGPAAAAHGVALHAYALMPAQVLLLVTPASATGPSRMLQAVGRRFGADYNRRHRRSGALWDGRFRASVLDGAHFLDGLRYVETAPLRTGEAVDAAQYAWSSAAHHLGARADPDIQEHPRWWLLGNTPFEREAAYRRLVEQPLAAPLVQRLDGAARTGWAVGDASFVQRLSEQASRHVTPRPRGRPPAKKTVPETTRGKAGSR